MRKIFYMKSGIEFINKGEGLQGIGLLHGELVRLETILSEGFGKNEDLAKWKGLAQVFNMSIGRNEYDLTWSPKIGSGAMDMFEESEVLEFETEIFEEEIDI